MYAWFLEPGQREMNPAHARAAPGGGMGANASGNFLYAANFHAGAIDVFDKDFHHPPRNRSSKRDACHVTGADRNGTTAPMA